MVCGQSAGSLGWSPILSTRSLLFHSSMAVKISVSPPKTTRPEEMVYLLNHPVRCQSQHTNQIHQLPQTILLPSALCFRSIRSNFFLKRDPTFHLLCHRILTRKLISVFKSTPRHPVASWYSYLSFFSYPQPTHSSRLQPRLEFPSSIPILFVECPRHFFM